MLHLNTTFISPKTPSPCAGIGDAAAKTLQTAIARRLPEGCC
jgi:hypothetical protein